jgi:hypothetical protein
MVRPRIPPSRRSSDGRTSLAAARAVGPRIHLWLWLWWLLSFHQLHLSASPCWHWQRPPPPDPHAPCPTLHQPLPGTSGFWIGLTLMLLQHLRRMLLQHLRRMLLIRARLHASIILANNGTSSQTAGSASEWPSLDAKTRAFVMCSLPRQKVRVLSSFLEKCWDSFVGTFFSAGVEQIMSITC